MTLHVLGFGLSPYGLGEPSVAEARAAAPVMVAEDYDPKTNELRSLTVPADPVDAQVQLAMTAVIGSGAVTGELGQAFGDIRKLGDDAEVLLEKAARDALARLVRNRDIDVLSVTVEVGDDWAEVMVDYYNRRATTKPERSYTRRF